MTIQMLNEFIMKKVRQRKKKKRLELLIIFLLPSPETIIIEQSVTQTRLFVRCPILAVSCTVGKRATF